MVNECTGEPVLWI